MLTRHKIGRIVLETAILVTLLATVDMTRAEPISLWGSDASRAVRPGAYVPHDGAPFSHRYNYPEPSLFLWGDYARDFWKIERMEREERLQQFGSRYGPEHPPLFNRLLERHGK